MVLRSYIEAKMRDRSKASGFTVIEILVAIAVLGIIVYIVAKMYSQSLVAMEVGNRRAEMNMNARAIMDFVTREMSQAVADSVLPGDFPSGDDSITFVILNSTNERAAAKVTYTLSGTDLTREYRVCSAGGYPSWNSSESPATLISGVVELEFAAMQDDSSYGSSTTNLPVWVDVYMRLRADGVANRKDAEKFDLHYTTRVALKNRARYKYE